MKYFRSLPRFGHPISKDSHTLKMNYMVQRIGANMKGHYVQHVAYVKFCNKPFKVNSDIKTNSVLEVFHANICGPTEGKPLGD